MQTGDLLGHEAMGIVDSVGPQVTRVKVGDRVVISAPISCGQCEYCRDERYSQCDRTNPAATTEYLYGHRPGALFGYSHLTGGVAGSQADYCRVPFADVNLIVVPPHLSDEQVLLLSDVMCTVSNPRHATATQDSRAQSLSLQPLCLLLTVFCCVAASAGLPRH